MRDPCRAGIKRVECCQCVVEETEETAGEKILTGRNDRGRARSTLHGIIVEQAMDPVLRRPPACHSACRTQVDVCGFSLSRPRRILNQSLVIKTFPSVSLSGVRNSPMVQRASLTPSQPLSKHTLSCVFLPMHNPPN
jgi:hypothetical protein